MGKKRKGARRLNKNTVADMVQSLFQAHPNETLTFKQIFKALKMDTHPAKMMAMDVMEEMAWDDWLSKVGEGAYKLNLKTQVQEGTFMRKSNGKNTFVPDDGGMPVFVAERNSMFAVTGDRVRVAYMARRQNHIKEAIVTEIIERKHDQAVGILQVEKEFAFLNAEGNIFAQDILIPKKKLKGGKTGEKAVVKITQWPSAESKSLVGEVIDVLGRQGDNTVEMHSILAQYGLPYKYPKRVEEAANNISDVIPADEIARREDFRHVLTFTIDPADAKDFDDALSIRRLPGNQLFEVAVHIADVSYYVSEGTVIDREAQQRATSVYLVDRTIPMLPERLCNFICSLRPGEDKLCYSVIFTIDEEATIKTWHLAHTIIRSDRRYAYEEVQEMLEGKNGDYAKELRLLSDMAQNLRERRFRNGAVKFDREELHFDIDKDGKPTRCFFKKSTLATQLIEEFMLLANRTVSEAIACGELEPREYAYHGGYDNHSGRRLYRTHEPEDQVTEQPSAQATKRPSHKKTFVYRIHDQPDPQKLENLRSVVAAFGYKVKTTGTKGAIAKSLNQLMTDAQGKREQKLIETVALRAMMKAKYSTHNIGHYGLAFDNYTHFTSPIRRYPDTMVHRLLTKYQNGGRSANQEHYEELCEHSSNMEQTAQNAERDSIKYKMVEFMADKVGMEFDAHISGVQSYGIYCEIDENHCEGLVGMHDLDGDYYEFDERNYQLVGRRHHRKYQLGDAVRIKVARANLEKRQLDFILAERSFRGKS